MDLTPYVERLREQLAVAAEAGGEDARALAERLNAPLDSATRLVLLDALSRAAGEITRDLAPGSVDVRLRGLDPEFVVTPPPADEGAPADTAESSVPEAPPADEGVTSRINLRLPEHLKLRIEEAAAREGLSVNAWLVRSIAATLGLQEGGRRPAPRHPASGERYTGWVR